jgi:hypothetical protein
MLMARKAEPPPPTPSAAIAAPKPAEPAPTAVAATAPTAATPTAAAPTGAVAPTTGAAPALPNAAGTAAPSTDTAAPAAASGKTQDEQVLGKIEISGPAKIKGAKLRPKDVTDAVREQLPAMQRCYTELLEDKPGAEGALTFGFSIDKKGKASGVKKLSGPAKDPGMARCATSALGNAKFPKPKKPAKVTLPLRFATKH